MQSLHGEPVLALAVPATPQSLLSNSGLAAGDLLGARKHVTVLFVDLVGSTRLVAAMDPEDARAFLRSTMQHLQAVIERNSGVVVQSMGDGLFSLFGAPLALENHAFLACHAALELQRTAALLPDILGERPKLRVGLNSGVAVVHVISGEMNHIADAAGEVIHRAAHLEARCAPGGVLVGQETVRLAGRAIEVRRAPDAKSHKGADQVCFELIRCGDWSNALRVDAVDGQIPFTGRRRERAVIGAGVDDVLRGQGSMVTVVGDAGIGKSRLLFECIAELDGERCEAVTTSCLVTDQGQPLAVLRRVVLGLLNLGENSRQSPGDALRSMIVAVAPCVAHSVEALNWLLLDEGWHEDPDPENTHAMALETLETLLQQYAHAKPLVIAIDDVQWMDASSRTFVQRLGHKCPRYPLLIFLTSRGEPGELGAASQQVLKLMPFERKELTEILAGMDGNQKLRAGLRERALERCAGNPRFLVEIARSIQSASGTDEDRLMEEPEIPESVADLFEERIDKLDPADKSLLQLAAAYEQWLSSIAASLMTRKPVAAVLDAMQRLQAQGLARLAGGANDAALLVANPIVARAAYRSLLREDRQRVHGTICDFAAGMQLPEARWLARQTFRAGRYGVAAKGFFDAGRGALARLAYGEAAALLRSGIRAHELSPNRDAAEGVDMRLVLRDALFPTADFERIDTILAEAAQLAEAADDTPRLRLVHRQQVSNFMALGRLSDCLPGARELAAPFMQGERSIGAQDEAALLAQILMSLGQYDEALGLCTTLVACARGSDEHTQQVQHSLALMWALWCSGELGRFQSSIPLVLEAQSDLDEARPPLVRLCAGIGTGLYWLRYRDNALAIDTLTKVLPLAEDDDTLAWFPAVASPLGLALARMGRIAEALPLLRNAVARTPVRGGTGRGLRVAHLAECHLLNGDVTSALRYATEAIDFCERVREAGAAAHARLVLARALIASARREEGCAAATLVMEQAGQLKMKPLLQDAAALCNPVS